METNLDQAIQFLRDVYPDGPWAITAIVPDGPTKTLTFFPASENECRRFIAEENRTKNVYYHVNRVSKPITKKADKSDIDEVHYLQVDIDLAGSASEQNERAEILSRLTTAGLVPYPNVIVNSGGGYNALWKLNEPFSGDFDEIESRNQWLVDQLGGDSAATDISRVLRLPGTINYPTKTKRQRGRVPVLSRTEGSFDDTVAYSLSEFGTSKLSTRRAETTDATPEPIDAETFNELPQRVRAIATCGEPEWHYIATWDRWGQPVFPSDRSTVCVKLAGEALREGVPESVILGLLLDPDLPVGGHCNDQADPLRAARRALARAAVSESAQRAIFDLRKPKPSRGADKREWLDWMNGRHAVIGSVGGKCRIATVSEQNNREVFEFSSFEDIRNRYSNIQVEVGTNSNNEPVWKPLGEWWAKHSDRQQYDAMAFDPSEPAEFDGKLNIWRGFTVEPEPGDWSAMRRHVLEVLACGNEGHAEYILKWAAFAVQYPDQPAGVAVVFRGGEGTGKGTFVRWLGRLFGQHFQHVTHIDHVTGKFNAHLEDCVLLFGDEAFCVTDSRAIGQLKGRVTEPTIPLERKGVDIKSVENRLHIIMASNEQWIVPASANDRRFVVFDVSDRRRNDNPYFNAIHSQMAAGGLAAMLHDLQQMDLGDWRPWVNRPQTSALRDQQVESLTGMARAWFGYLSQGEIEFGVSREGGRVFVATRELARMTELDRRKVTDFLKTPPDHGQMQMASMGFPGEKDSLLGRGIVVPSLAAARAKWDEVMFPVDWDDAAAWEVPGG